VPIAPILFAVVSVLIVVNQIRANWQDATMGLAIVATGFPAYYLWSGLRPPANSTGYVETGRE